MRWILALVAMVLVVAACSFHKSSVRDHRYSLIENNCDTGEHAYRSMREMCQALRDDKVNRGCAADLRAELFKANGCTGDFASLR